MNKKNFDGFISNNGLYKAASARPITESLPSGAYTLLQDPDRNLYFKTTKTNHDKLIALPDPAYETVVNEMIHFLKPETKARFSELGYLYKRSSLLFGLPGTGKTSIVNRVSQSLLETGGIILFNPNPTLLEEGLEVLRERNPNSTVLVIFEELDQLMYNYESNLLNILDGEVQTENIIYLATTNFIKKIPPRIMRPGRFSSVIEVGFPNLEARTAYLNSKLDQDRAVAIAEVSEGLSIDELKEVVQSVECFSYGAKDVIKRIKEIKQLAGSDARDEYYYESESPIYDNNRVTRQERRDF